MTYFSILKKKNNEEVMHWYLFEDWSHARRFLIEILKTIPWILLGYIIGITIK